MAKLIQVRNVPDDVHAALVAEASRRGLSLSDYLRLHFASLAARRPTWEEFFLRLPTMERPPNGLGAAEVIREIREER